MTERTAGSRAEGSRGVVTPIGDLVDGRACTSVMAIWDTLRFKATGCQTSPKRSDCSPILTVGHLSLILPSQLIYPMPLQGSRLVHPVQSRLDIHTISLILLWQRGESGMWNIPNYRDVVVRSWMGHGSVLLLWVVPECLSTAILCTLPTAVSWASLRGLRVESQLTHFCMTSKLFDNSEYLISRSLYFCSATFAWWFAFLIDSFAFRMRDYGNH